MQRFTVLEEDLDTAILERKTFTLSCSCLITQTFLRELKLNISRRKITTTCLSFRRGISLNILDGKHKENTAIEDPILEQLMNDFDMQRYSEIRDKLPYSFEFEISSIMEQ